MGNHNSPCSWYWFTRKSCYNFSDSLTSRDFNPFVYYDFACPFNSPAV